MGVGGQESDDLVAGDAHGDGAADGLARDLAGHHVRVARREPAEQLQDGDLQRRGRVRVDAVVGLDHEEAFAVGGAERVLEARGYAA